MRDLIPGERAPLTGEQTFTLAGDGPTLALIALGPDRRESPAFPPIDAVTRELRPAAQFEEAGRLRLDPDALPAAVDRLLLVAFDRTAAPIRRSVSIATLDLRFTVDLNDRPDAAIVLLECYRHQGAWRMAANGQGYAQGLTAIAAAHGVDHGWANRLLARPGHDHRESPDRQRGSGPASGSGVCVDRHHILTNAHVVEDQPSIRVHAGGRPLDADTVFVDSRNDLALLRIDAVLPTVAQFRSEIGLHLGEDIVALGFPLQGLLGTGPQASAGNIAALCGIGNDSSVFQFTAPIASGNSGGPILDMAGHLVGVVSSSLNLERIRLSGANAENINFGIKGAIIMSFLDSFGLEPQMAPANPRQIGRAAVVKQAQSAIARIICA